MLIRFRVQNFLSFKNEAELSMVAGKVQQHPAHVMRDASRGGLDLLRAAMIYGANASGKSNLVKAMDFARHMIVDGVRAKSAIPRKPFKLDPNCLVEPSRFEFEIQYKGKIFAYGFILDSKRIHEEWLYEIRPASERMLFLRTTSVDEQNRVELGVKASKRELGLLEWVALATPPNRLFLQASIENNIKHFADVYEWFDDVLCIIYPGSLPALGPIQTIHADEFGALLAEHLQRLGTGVGGFLMQPVSDPGVELPEDLLQRAEESLHEGEGSFVAAPQGQRYFLRKAAEQVDAYRLLLSHSGETTPEQTLFDADEESDGTLRLLDLIPVLYPSAHRQNAVFVIDELDRSLHPNLSAAFIQTFMQADVHTQLIVTTHEANLLDLDLVRRDEVWFVEKNAGGASALYSLEEFAPRYDKDVRKGYMLGRFGAVPAIIRPAPLAEAG